MRLGAAEAALPVRSERRDHVVDVLTVRVVRLWCFVPGGDHAAALGEARMAPVDGIAHAESR